MIVTELPCPLSLPESVGRSEGIHQSAIIRCIATEMGILTPEVAEELSLLDVRKITDPTAIIRICMGLAWEEWYIPQLQDVADHPGELEIDGIYMTPDGESLSSVIITPERPEWVLMVHEIKCTYKSVRTVGDLATQFMWLAQIKGYCKAKNTRFAMLHCLFVCGDYTFPIRPQLKKWMIEFSWKEIEDNWKLLTDYRNERLKNE